MESANSLLDTQISSTEEEPKASEDSSPSPFLPGTNGSARLIADALADVEEDDMRKKFFALKGGSYKELTDEKRFMEMWLRLQDLKVFFEAAAENMEAVVFTAKFQD
jgi:hypothetical protein